MCTVVIEVGALRSAQASAVRLLAVRDEDPERAWDPLGAWWPEHPDVIGIRDRRAGGAWLAAHPATRRLAVLLNRADVLDLPAEKAVSRGALALESVLGRSPQLVGGTLPMHGFNLLEATDRGARVLSWDGETLRTHPIPAGVHMIAHSDLDDPGTPRIQRWLPEFRAQPAHDPAWPDDWIAVLAESAELDPEDDRAIIRDNRPHGYPTQSLLYCTASIDDDGLDVHGRTLPAPARWNS